MICSKVSFGEKNYKHFIVYKNDDCKIYLLSIILPKTNAYVKSYYSETRWIEDEELWKKYNDIWNKDNNSLKIGIWFQIPLI